MARISIIAALSAQTRAIGKGNALLWRLPEDLKFFKQTTLGHPVIMGRKTWDSLPPSARPLPGRTNIVVTRDPHWAAPGATVAHSVQEALDFGLKTMNDELFIIGGAQIYEAALPYTDRLYLTLVDDPGTGADAFFPEYEKQFTKVITEEKETSGGIPFRRVTLER